MLEQEGELAALADAVEVAVDLVILTTCKKKTVVNSLQINLPLAHCETSENSYCTKCNIISETVL